MSTPFIIGYSMFVAAWLVGIGAIIRQFGDKSDETDIGRINGDW